MSEADQTTSYPATAIADENSLVTSQKKCPFSAQMFLKATFYMAVLCNAYRIWKKNNLFTTPDTRKYNKHISTDFKILTS